MRAGFDRRHGRSVTSGGTAGPRRECATGWSPAGGRHRFSRRKVWTSPAARKTLFALECGSKLAVGTLRGIGSQRGTKIGNRRWARGRHHKPLTGGRGGSRSQTRRFNFVGQLCLARRRTRYRQPPTISFGRWVGSDGVARCCVPDPATIQITRSRKGPLLHAGRAFKPSVAVPSARRFERHAAAGRGVVESLHVSRRTTRATDRASGRGIWVFYQATWFGLTVSGRLGRHPVADLRSARPPTGRWITVELDGRRNINSRTRLGTIGWPPWCANGERALQVPAKRFQTNVPVEIEGLTLDTIGITLPAGAGRFIGEEASVGPFAARRPQAQSSSRFRRP